MSDRKQTMQQLIRRRQQSGFVGRRIEVSAYVDNLTVPIDDENRRFLFNIHGNAGVGKTSLIRQLHRHAADRSVACAYVDERIDDALGAMATISADFGRAGKPLSVFDDKYSEYRQRRTELESDPHAPDGASMMLTKIAVRIGLGVTRSMPVVGPFADMVEADTVAEQADRLRVFLTNKFRSHDDVRLMLSPVEQLTPVFVSDLQRVATDQQLALFFDTYERTVAVLDQWLIDLLDSRYGDLPANLTLTVAGQHALDRNRWAQFLGEIVEMELSPFSEAEARQLLAQKNVRDEQIVSLILRESARLPLLVAMLAEARPDDPAAVMDPSDSAVERFLRWERDPQRREAAMLAALPRMLNADILSALLGVDDVAGSYDWLHSLPFVVDRGGVCQYHPVVRTPMLRLQRNRSPQRWEAKHRLLADYFAGCRAKLKLGKDDITWLNARWVEFLIEESYHRLNCDPEHHLPVALSQIALSCAFSQASPRRWAEMLFEAGVDGGNELVRERGEALRSHSADDVEDRLRFLSTLQSDRLLPRKDLPLVLTERGHCNARMRRFRAAIDDYTLALGVDADAPITLVARAEAYAPLREWATAIKDLDRAIELRPKRGLYYVLRAEAYAALGDHEGFLRDFDHAMELGPVEAAYFIRRGEANRRMGRYDEAIADFNRAVQIDPTEDGHVRSHRSRAYYDAAQYQNALTDVEALLVETPADVVNMARRGNLLRLIGRHEEALSDLDRVVEERPSNAWVLAERGEIHRLLHHYEEALTDFSAALELDPSDGWAWSHRGVSQGALERYDDAIVSLNRAIELEGDESGHSFGHRAEVFLAMGRLDEAIADMDHAVQVSPEDMRALVNRARVYVAAHRYEDAVGDLNKAIALEPENESLRLNRAVQLARLGRTPDALADMDWLVARTPDDEKVREFRERLATRLEQGVSSADDTAVN